MSNIEVTRSSANAAPRGLLVTLAALVNQKAASLWKSGDLRIAGGSGSALAEIELVIYGMAKGVIFTKAAGQDMPALVGTVDNAEFGIFIWTINSGGTIQQLTLATAATLAAIVLPEIPEDEAIIGALLINPTGTGDFVGGTTDIDDATVTPGAVFFNGTDMNLGNRVVFPGGVAPGL